MRSARDVAPNCSARPKSGPRSGQGGRRRRGGKRPIGPADPRARRIRRRLPMPRAPAHTPAPGAGGPRLGALPRTRGPVDEVAGRDAPRARHRGRMRLQPTPLLTRVLFRTVSEAAMAIDEDPDPQRWCAQRWGHSSRNCCGRYARNQRTPQAPDPQLRSGAQQTFPPPPLAGTGAIDSVTRGGPTADDVRGGLHGRPRLQGFLTARLGRRGGPEVNWKRQDSTPPQHSGSSMELSPP